MRSEIIAVGTEFLLGTSSDTDSTYLAGRLSSLGIDLFWISQIGDNLGRLTESLQRALDRSDIVITSGGLGPTEDDITREAIAAALGEEMTVDSDTEAWLRNMFERRGRPMPSRNIKQAMLIPSASALANPRGTAPGWWVEKDENIVVALPGPPRELELMWETLVEPRLKERSSDHTIISRTLKVAGIGEASLDEMLSPHLSSPNPTIGIYAKRDGNQVRLTAKASKEPEARELLVHLEGKVREILGDSIWGTDDETLEQVVGNLLKERGLGLATIESVTGGQIANTITNVPGSSAYFLGGVVAYSPEAKIQAGVKAELIEEFGTVSAKVAQDMARAARSKFSAQVGLATTGVAGPEELEGKPAGTVFIALDDGDRQEVQEGHYPPRRLDVKRWATVNALHLLRRRLVDMGAG
jgi:nicotinamide-nucleotide amidase